MRIIALAGRKGSAKSTIKEMLIDHPAINPDQTWQCSFGAAAKSMLAAIGIPEDSLFGNDEQKSVPLPQFGGVTGRHLMVTLATEWGRNMIHPDIWVMVMEHELEEVKQSAFMETYIPTVIIDDLRFQNEYDFLKSKGAFIIGVERGELPGSMLDQHISEQLPYRFEELGIPVLKNDSTLAELHQKVIALAVPNP